MIPPKNSITPIRMLEEDGSAITHLKRNVREESFPTANNKLEFYV